MKDVCLLIVRLLNEYILPHTETAEGLVFMNKMKGDYWRYIAEFA